MPVLIRGCFPFIRESDGRRDTACAEGKSKSSGGAMCKHTHMPSKLLSLGGAPAESQMN